MTTAPIGDFTIPFAYGDVIVQVHLTTINHFEMIKNMIDDLGSSNITPIPILNDAVGEPIHFSVEELQTFISLFELCHNILKNEDDLFQTISEMDISFNQIKKFMILINFLDNQKFLDSLCKYTAKLIRDGKVIL